MSMLSDYQRLVEKPRIAALEREIAALKAMLTAERSRLSWATAPATGVLIIAAAIFSGYLVGAAVTRAAWPGCSPPIILHRVR